MVFGVWGALVVFGWRYRNALAARYRKYFLGSVIPYSAFALYFGTRMPGIDLVGHLGGLIAGATVALFTPSRLLLPERPARMRTAVALCAIAGVMLVLAWFPAGPGALSSTRVASAFGFVVPVPERWRSLVNTRHYDDLASYAFGNGVGVGMGFESRLESPPVSLDEATSQFVTLELAAQLDDFDSIRILDPEDTSLDGRPAKRIRADIVSGTTVTRADYVIVEHGAYRHVLSMNAPLWLSTAYRSTFDAIIAGVRINDGTP
jgi:hypothetical protein